MKPGKATSTVGDMQREPDATRAVLPPGGKCRLEVSQDFFDEARSLGLDTAQFVVARRSSDVPDGSIAARAGRFSATALIIGISWIFFKGLDESIGRWASTSVAVGCATWIAIIAATHARRWARKLSLWRRPRIARPLQTDASGVPAKPADGLPGWMG